MGTVLDGVTIVLCVMVFAGYALTVMALTQGGWLLQGMVYGTLAGALGIYAVYTVSGGDQLVVHLIALSVAGLLGFSLMIFHVINKDSLIFIFGLGGLHVLFQGIVMYGMEEHGLFRWGNDMAYLTYVLGIVLLVVGLLKKNV